LLAEALAPYTEDLSGFWFDFGRRFGDVRRFYTEHEWFRSLCQGAVALVVVASLDAFMGHPVTVRLLYIVPVFVASYRGDWFSSAFVTGATLMVLTGFDYEHRMLEGETASLGVVVNVVTLCLASTFIVFMQRRVRRIHKIANHDALTGAMARTAIQEKAEQMIERSKEEGTSVTVGVIDCNGFKRINDVRGHSAGDEVLVLLAATVGRAVGPNGALGRIGGDEFVFVVPDRSEEFVGRMIEHAREAFAEAVYFVAPMCTFSVGTARLGRDGESYGELVNAADARMYREKAAIDTVRAAVRMG
jgi:diguanylate cyclase (GGDEF)-like protein